jgi:hypothetical protein
MIGAFIKQVPLGKLLIINYIEAWLMFSGYCTYYSGSPWCLLASSP